MVYGIVAFCYSCAGEVVTMPNVFVGTLQNNGPVAYELRYFNNMQIKRDVTSVVLIAAILYC